ncbi:MAG: cytochrome c oxidase subunit II [Pseudomonadota bacterium]|uniref:Cytochrome c oxidase subunit 2 n=1 Tax=Roseibium aggregatum TaxID=187304 RepID=A0A0M6Y6C9_9HYPH|nr:cytochrome c oxidase subunit II [Paracoccaceae bacterium]MEC9405381.1 cytochrome c oxidase subunit II [Pseudomonadota bacterium]QFT65281.1 Cytochrome c oxidase subunit 2 precursor [Labrenzia sp. THAF35]CTQ44939.1 Cytochrome c oxidase subunit 2 precursor [Roseibium aggregatum]MEC9420666.1 cytochrome c oxidase subunit II [Pseudomonadota bacterium]
MKAVFKRLMTMAGAAATFAGVSTAALAAESGIKEWQLGFQASVTDVMDDITWFNGFTLVIITVITLFVLALLIVCMTRFSAKKNPVPSRTSHNTMIEVVWTVAPILILVVIAIPSFRLLYKQLDIPEYEMTVKAIGYQWYWGYEYTDENMGELAFDSLMIGDPSDPAKDLAARQEVADARGVSLNEVPRLLSVDYDLVIPVDTTVRMQVTSEDVIHSFAMPSFGVKVDAIPGRLNETWFHAREEGVYYGQCSELCGKAHAFMPIAVRVVSKDQFQTWATAAQDDLDTANQQLLASIADTKKLAAAGKLEEISVAAK